MPSVDSLSTTTISCKQCVCLSNASICRGNVPAALYAIVTLATKWCSLSNAISARSLAFQLGFPTTIQSKVSVGPAQETNSGGAARLTVTWDHQHKRDCRQYPDTEERLCAQGSIAFVSENNSDFRTPSSEAIPNHYAGISRRPLAPESQPLKHDLIASPTGKKAQTTNRLSISELANVITTHIPTKIPTAA